MEMDKHGMQVMMRGKVERKGWTMWIHKHNNVDINSSFSALEQTIFCAIGQYSTLAQNITTNQIKSLHLMANFLYQIKDKYNLST